MKAISGKIFDDMRVISYHHKDKTKAWWAVECIFCHKRKIMARPKILEGVGTHCVLCTNKKGNVLKAEEIEITDEYNSGIAVKIIAYNHSLSLRSVYNILHRTKTNLRRKKDDNDSK